MKETSSGPGFSKNLMPVLAILGLALLALASSYLRVEAGAGTTGEPARPSVGLRVHPPVMWAPGVTPGVAATLPAPITVENTGARPVRYEIVPIKPSSLGINVMQGYADIPDPAWCSLEEDDFTLQPDESRSVAVTIFVPDDVCLNNRSWCVAFAVQSISGGTLGAAAYPYVYLETTSELTTPRPPEATDGARALPEESQRGTGTNCLIVGPGILDAGDVPAGTTAQAGPITIVNGYDYDVKIEVRPVVPQTGRLIRTVLITPGYMWIEDAGWLRPSNEDLFILAGEEAQFEIDVASPPDSSMLNFRWEGFLKISTPQGPQALVRVHWHTTPPTADKEPLVRAPGRGD